MVNKRSMGGMVAALAMFLAFPALASAHILAVSAGPSHCVTPLDGSYTSAVTVTETYFGGTTENIPVGQNVYELSTSTDTGNTGLNQNYFTQGSVGTQTGPANLGQPVSFTSPRSGGAATLTFTVTTSVPETYVLGNSYMYSPSSTRITAPASGCTPPPPPPPPTCPSGQTLINGVCVPPTSCPAGETLSGGQCVPPNGCPTGETLENGHCTPPTTCPSGETLVNGQCTPPSSCPSGETLSGGQCVPPSSCPSGETLAGSQCVPPTDCPAGETMTAGACTLPPAVPAAATFPSVCRASTKGYKVRAGQQDTVIVSVNRHGAPVAGAKIRVTVPGGKVLTRRTGKHGTATFRMKPAHGGTIFVRSSSCKETVKVKVYAAKAATAVRAPSFTG